MAVKRKNDIRLSRRIYFYLLTIAFLSVFSVSFFWIEYELNHHKKEVRELKNTFSHSKKIEIKNKILQIKDYIQWIQEKPIEPISKALTKQVTQLKLGDINLDSTLTAYSELLLKSVSDSISQSRVPTFIVNKKGQIIKSYNPFSDNLYSTFNNKTADVIEQVIERDSEEAGIVTLYKTYSSHDSILVAIAYFNNKLVSDYSVLSIVSLPYFKKALQVYVLDSISRLRYDDNEYIYVNTLSGNALITNGNYNKSPINIYDSDKPDWMNIFNVQKTAASIPDGVFHTYNWLNLSTSQSTLKTSYVSYVSKWEWIIGTGFHEDGIEKQVEFKRKSLNADLMKILFKAALYLFISSLLCYILVMVFTKRFGKNIKVFNDFFAKAANENLLIDKSQINYQEFKFMVDAANLMVEERRKTMDELRKSEEKFSKAFKNSPDAILITTLHDGKIIEVDDVTTQLTSYSRDELIGGSIDQLHLWANNDHRSIYAKLLKEKGRVRNMEVDFKMKSGEIRNGLISGEVIDIQDQVCILSIIRDITERKLAQERLRESEERYRLISSVASDYMFTSGIDDKGKLKLNWVAGAFENITGYSVEEYIAIGGWRSTIHSDDLEIDDRDFEKLQNNQKVITELRTYSKEGKIVWVRVYAHPIWDDNKKRLIGIYGAVEDITERKHAENQISKLNEELELRVTKRTAELESFSYSISHDLRAPLRAIYGFSQILATRHRESLNDEGKQYMDYVVESSIRMEQLINDLLNYSRLGRSSLDIIPVALNSVIEEVYSDFELSIKEVGGSFTIDGELPEINADWTLLRQIFINLIGNAVKYRHPDKRLKIRISGDSNEEGFLIRITDNGIGIPPEHHEKIFNVFQRLHNEAQYPGTGIGLATVKKAVDMLDGSVWVESVDGGGSTFFIHFKK